MGQGGMDAAREGERERRVGATLFRCDLHQQATIKWLSPRQWAPADARTRVQLTVSAVFRAVKSVIRLEIAAAPFGKFAGICWHFCFVCARHFWSVTKVSDGQWDLRSPCICAPERMVFGFLCGPYNCSVTTSDMKMKPTGGGQDEF